MRSFKTILAVALAAVAVGLLALTVLVSIARTQLRDASVQQVELVRSATPGAPVAPVAPVATDVELHVRGAELFVVPAPAGTAFAVDATYDPGVFTLEQRETPGDPGGWHVSFTRTGGGGGLMQELREQLGAPRAEVRVRIPRDAPVRLRVSTDSNTTDVELGGLSVQRLDAETAHSCMIVRVSEPIDVMERLVIHAQQSQVTLHEIGNASPRELELRTFMGEAHVDLGGAWRSDSAVSIDTRLAGSLVTLPDGVDVEGLERTGTLAAIELPRPTLRFDVERVLAITRFADD